MKAVLYMMVGLPGAGKSHTARELHRERLHYHRVQDDGRAVCRLSSDSIREELYGSEDIQGDPVEVFEIMRQRAVEALKRGDDVIYDACNINSKRRKSLLSMLKHTDCTTVCIIMATPYAECLSRNKARKRAVPETAIRRMYLSWHTPYYFEGWDEIRLVYAEGSERSFGKPEDFVRRLDDYDQETPFHGETLGVHMRDTARAIVDKGYPEGSNLAIAALLHDCGKPYTKFFNIDSSRPDIAHYYSHEGTGAYDAMFFNYGKKNEEDVLEISMLINKHMEPFSWEREETLKKKEKTLGHDLVQTLLILHEADQAASQSKSSRGRVMK